MDRGAWQATVHGVAESNTAQQLTVSLSFTWKGPSGDLLDPGIEPVSPVTPALAGGFSTTEPPENPHEGLGL